MFGLGMSYQDIASPVVELYSLSVCTATISAVTDKFILELKQWQQRSIESHYPFVWLDAIRCKPKEDGRYAHKAVYTVLGLNLAGERTEPSACICRRRFALFTLLRLTEAAGHLLA